MIPTVKLPTWVLVMVRSGVGAALTVVGSLSELLPGTASLPPETVAVLVTNPVAVGFTVSVMTG